MRYRALLLPLILAVAPSHLAAGQQNDAKPSGNDKVRVEMRNIVFHFADNAGVHIIQLEGLLTPTHAGKIPVFDDANSYSLAVSDARIVIAPEALAQLLNDHAFAAKDSPLKELSIAIKDDKLLLKGLLAKKGDLPIEATGTLATTEDGQIRLHTDHFKAAHLPVKGLMDLFGMEIGNLISTKKLPGIRIEDNDLILDAGQVLPPPHIDGKLTGIRIHGNQIEQTFGNPRPLKDAQLGNYMAYSGNNIRFGKLTMGDTDLVLIDMDPHDPFDFYLAHYRDQLVAGYSKTTPQFGLRVFMRDFNKLKRTSQVAQASPAKPR